MVQLGICAFRQGMIKDAHNALLDIQSSGRAKELLGQGLLMRNMQERNAEQEKIEKRRQVGLIRRRIKLTQFFFKELKVIIYFFAWAGTLPHAHQPGAAGMCVPGVSHAVGNPLHGRPWIWCPSQDDQQAVPPPAQGGREAATVGYANLSTALGCRKITGWLMVRLLLRTPREYEGACCGCQQSHENGRLAHMPLIHHQWEDEQ